MGQSLPERDTVKCLLLVNGTEAIKRQIWVVDGSNHNGVAMFSIYGYVIRKRYDNYTGVIDPGIDPDFKRTEWMALTNEYLTQNKKTLSKSIIVWQSKLYNW